MDRDAQRKAEKTYGIGLSVFILAFSVIWCVIVASVGAWFMLLFGLPFVGLAGYRLAMTLKISKSRQKERDPWELDQHETYTAAESAVSGCRHCPYCGESVEERFVFCPICGRRLR